MTYEGARSVTGAFLGSLGASAAVVGFTAGFGELMGYGLRSAAGYLSARTGRYWLLTIFGYVINMLAVPARGGRRPDAAGGAGRCRSNRPGPWGKPPGGLL